MVFTATFYNFIPVVFNSIYGGDYNWYIFAIEIGVLFAKDDFIGKIFKNYSEKSSIGKVTIGILLFVCTWIPTYISWFKMPGNAFGICPLLHTVSATACILFCFFTLKKSALGKPLGCLGKYSGDMFIIHIIVFSHLEKIIFASHNIFLQYALCVIICFIFSFALSLAKNKLGYNKVIAKVCRIILESGKI